MAGVLETVTLTGADDSVDPRQLRKLSDEFPFVEWGILIGSNFGGTRFPSGGWIRNLIEERVGSNNTMHLSLHICGRWLREIAAGRSNLPECLGSDLYAFDRCQLNWHGERQAWSAIRTNILAAFYQLEPWEPTIINQLDGVNDELLSEASRRFRVAGLFDASHGSGQKPGEWPKSRVDMQCGWAGGLGPDNVAAEIPRIAEQAYGPFWIDMETKLFTGNQFDLAKCRSVLEAVDEFVAQGQT